MRWWVNKKPESLVTTLVGVELARQGQYVVKFSWFYDKRVLFCCVEQMFTNQIKCAKNSRKITLTKDLTLIETSSDLQH